MPLKQVLIVRDSVPHPLLPVRPPVPIGVFPVDVAGPVPLPIGPPAASSDLAGGSLWLYAAQIARQAPADSYCGVLIKSGKVSLQGQATVDATGVVHIRPADVLTVSFVTDPPTASIPIAAPGADAAAVSFNVPANATFQFGPDGAHVTAVGDFGATAYGTTVSLVRNATPNTYDAGALVVLIPADASLPNFTFASVQSQLFAPAGCPQIVEGAWALAISRRPVPQLGAAPDAGSVALRLGAATTAAWKGLAATQRFSSGLLIVGVGRLRLDLDYVGPAFAQPLPLWNEGSNGRRSTIDVNYAAGTTVWYTAAAGNEIVQINNATITAQIDRPIKVDGSRFDFSRLPAIVLVNQTGSGFHVAAQTTLMPASPQGARLALRNVLLAVGSPTSLGFNGILSDARVSSGTLTLQFPLLSLLPTLPDPYITPLSAPLKLANTPALTAAVTWADIDTPQLALSSPALALPTSDTAITPVPALLDVSTAADQLGVQVTQFRQPVPQFLIQGVDFSGTANGVSLLSLPEISWEPMYADGSDGSPPGRIVSQTDGPPGTLSLPNSVKLMPIAPTLLIPPMLAEANGGSLLDAEVTLPFGLYASIQDPHATCELVQPEFPNGLTGGLQIRLIPPVNIGPIFLPPDPGFRGSVSTRNDTYGNQVLGNTGAVQPFAIFNAQFTTNVPLLRYDFCGYGASLFSDWRKTKPVGTSVIKVQFDVLVGRTAYEVVQLQSLICPWGILVVRTITIDRKNAGGVLRHDSGWQAASDGLLALPGAFQAQPGPLGRVTAVRNIRDAGSAFTFDNLRHWGPVTFDADFVLASGLTVRGGTAGADRLPSRQITGYLVADALTNATPADVNLLLQNRTAVGAVAGTVDVAATGVQMRAAQMTVSCVMSGATAVLVAALRGSPVLPSTGSWTVTRRAATVGAQPIALDPRTPVPLCRNSAEAMWRLAEPADVLNLAPPQTEYGLMQSTGTQKVYFPQPQMIPPAAPPPPGAPGPGFHMPQPPNLADVGALFSASGLFPDLRAALQFQGATADLQASADGAEIHGSIDTSAFPARPLVDFGAVKVLIDYHDENGAPAKPQVDITPGGWSIDLGRVTLLLVTPLGADPLLRIAGDAKASSSAAPTLANLNVIYGGALAPIENIFANLQQLAQFLPGGAGAHLDVTFSGTTLTIREVFALPRLPLGVGFIKDIALDIGMTLSLLPPGIEFTSGIGSVAKPFNWLVSPLSGTGVVQVGVKDGDLAVLIQAGIGAGLSIDVGIAEGAASVVIALQVTITGPNLNLMVLLTAQASVDVLDGLASATLSLTAGLGVTPHPFPPRLPPSTKPLDSVTLSAAVGVGIHLTVCWLVHVDFDGYWQFSKTLDVPDLTSVIPI